MLKKGFLLLLIVWLSGCSDSSSPDSIYVIGRDRTWEPLNLMGKDKNLLALSDEVIYAVAANQGLKVRLVSDATKTLFAALERGQIDAIVTYNLPDPIKSNRYLYSEPFFLLGPVLVVRADTNFSSLTDMKNRVVGVQTGSSLAFNVRQAPGIIFTPFENIQFALRGLSEGQLDGVIMEALPAYEYTSSFYRNILRVVPPPLTDDGLRLVSRNRPKDKKLIDAFNKGLQSLYEDGTYRKLVDKWNLKDPARDYYEQINTPDNDLPL